MPRCDESAFIVVRLNTGLVFVVVGVAEGAEGLMYLLASDVVDVVVLTEVFEVVADAVDF